MATTVVQLPRVLHPVVGDVREVAVTGAKVQEALADLCRQLPALRGRIFDEAGGLRPHVMCVHNGVAIRLREAAPLADGDDVAIVPAVSGGGR